jgi:lysophospholipase L1-like esterase
MKSPLPVAVSSYSAPKPIVICQRNYCYALGPQTGNENYGMYRTVHASLKNASLSNIQATYGNYNTSAAAADTSGANTITIYPSLDLYNAGYVAPIPFTFSGKNPIPILPGQTITSDVLDPSIWIPPNTEFWDRCFVDAGPTGTWPLSNDISIFSEECQIVGPATINQSHGGQAFHVSGYVYGPMYITGIPSTPTACWLGLGDSVMVGFGDIINPIPGLNYSYAKGWFERLVGNAYGCVQLACGGQTAQQSANGGAIYRLGGNLGKYCTHAIMALGINDIGTLLHTASQVEANVATCVALLRSQGIAKVYVTTFQPQTTSTDNWATVANQSVYSFESNRLAYNNDIRSTNGAIVGADGYFEICIPCESSPGSGKFIANGTADYATADGLHPSPVLNGIVAAYNLAQIQAISIKPY